MLKTPSNNGTADMEVYYTCKSIVHILNYNNSIFMLIAKVGNMWYIVWSHSLSFDFHLTQTTATTKIIGGIIIFVNSGIDTSMMEYMFSKIPYKSNFS